jgi:hypothetical protein
VTMKAGDDLNRLQLLAEKHKERQPGLKKQ